MSRIAANITKLPELLRGPTAEKRGVTRLQPHPSRQSRNVGLDPTFRSIAAMFCTSAQNVSRKRTNRDARQAMSGVLGVFTQFQTLALNE